MWDTQAANHKTPVYGFFLIWNQNYATLHKHDNIQMEDPAEAEVFNYFRNMRKVVGSMHIPEKSSPSLTSSLSLHFSIRFCCTFNLLMQQQGIKPK